MKKIIWKSLLALSLVGFVASTALSQGRFDDVEVKAQAVGGSVYMLVGAGGNIAVSAGPDGLLIVDNQYADLADKIAASLADISKEQTRYVINTHFHGDHTGSNAFFSKHKNATIFAHENVRVRLSSGEETDPAMLPVVTYEKGVKFHMNGDTVHVFHLANAHTDGDSAVWFEQPDVMHTGDLFFKDWFPFIDLDSGGSVAGYIAAVETLLGMISDDTKVIPGHGALANKADYVRFLDMIKQTYAYVQAKKAAGISEDDLVEAGLEEKWKNWSWNFITEERWIRTIYK
ncbi:MBL fold metallo-hydrolase [Brumicola pallidula]|uniref:Zinc-dependent hydrolase n=1 Tax=Brumicola pallidula DSM 14239 = ACAM 615 TaxID=1121922 RepID=K7A123_9ALTE|nr:MBL fold metallo-hydrolase [Glaciecola pallidula]GAC29220.1 zinc-dependent hydrolase [Glaciecola pallidula DSM 14239 = ACAM 615]